MKLDFLAPYYQNIENPSEEIKIKISEESPKSYALTRAPNRMNSDGRINCEGLYEDGVVAVSVSPINPKFRSQIEDGVWPFIECLINKNYFTMSCCEGHNDRMGDHFYVTLASPCKNELKVIENEVEHIIGCKVTKKNSIANNTIVWHEDGNQLKTIENRTVVDVDAEAEDINNMYLRKYSCYYFLTIDMFANKDDIFDEFNLTNLKNRIIYLIFNKKSLSELLNKFKKLPRSTK